MHKYLFVILLLLLVACDAEYQQQRRNECVKECQKFTTLQVGDTFKLSDFYVIEPAISYRDSNVTTYRIRYDLFWWHVTVNNNNSKVRTMRSFK